MITITNEKVAGFDPRWAPFRGFSLLFDNPGSSLTPDGEWLNLTCAVDTDPEFAFYKTLRESLDAIGRDLLTNTYLFCPLPTYSYHVTAWDGGNDGNVTQVTPAHRPDLEAFLADLPRSLAQEHVFTRAASCSPLVSRPDWNIRFQFGELFEWGNAVLVARLEPADAASEHALHELVEMRSRLTAEFRSEFEIGPSESYTPHVSLGYFANQEAAQHATPCVDAWNQRFRERMRGSVLRFHRVSLYGFTDMATFYKAA